MIARMVDLYLVIRQAGYKKKRVRKFSPSKYFNGLTVGTLVLRFPVASQEESPE